MRAKVSAQNFLEIIKAAGNSISKGAFAGNNANALLTFDSEGKLEVYAINTTGDHEFFYKGIIPAKDVEEGSLGVDAKKLLMAAKSLGNADTIEISTEEEKLFLRDAAGGRYLFIGIDGSMPDVRGSIFEGDAIYIKEEMLFTSLSSLLPFVSDSITFPALGGVLFEKEEKNDTLRLVATDKYRMTILDAEIEGGVNVLEERIVPGRTLKAVLQTLRGIKKSVRKHNTAKLLLQKESFSLQCGVHNWVGKLIPGPFPSYRNVVEAVAEEDVETLRVDRKEILGVVKTLCNAYDGGLLRVYLRREENTLRIEGKDGKYFYSYGSVPYDTKRSRLLSNPLVVVNGRYLKDALNSFSDEDIDIELRTERTALVIRSTERRNHSHYLMPVVAEEESHEA